MQQQERRTDGGREGDRASVIREGQREEERRGGWRERG